MTAERGAVAERLLGDPPIRLADLADVVAGTVAPPQPGSGIVLFESQGVALQDVVIATLAHQRSEQQ